MIQADYPYYPIRYVFHMAFCAPSETRLVCFPSAAARCKKVSDLIEVMFCTFTLHLCSSGLILCRSNFLVTRCLQENMVLIIKCSIQHYFFKLICITTCIILV